MKKTTLNDIYESMNPDQKTMLHYLVGHALETGEKISLNTKKLCHIEGFVSSTVYSTLNEDQKRLVDYMVDTGVAEFSRVRGDS